MKIIVAMALLCSFAGCALSPPKPPECKGEFKPINVLENKITAIDKSSKIVRCNEGGAYGKQG